jgi:dTDP-4-dehydrorhamnose reductase
MRLLITGASGLVGAACARAAARQGHHVIGTVGRWTGEVPGATELRAVDLTEATPVIELVRSTAPDAIVNAAAEADPAACEAEPRRARRLNVDLPALLAAVAERTRARLVHLSSEQVFDGEGAPYQPGAATRPLNLYGRQKVESEQRVLAVAPNSAVVRPPLLLGNSPGGRRSPHEKMLARWAAGQAVPLYTDEIRQVCPADNLAAVLLELIGRPDLRGIFHWAGTEPVSRWEMGRRIAAHFSVDEKWLVPMTRADTPAVSATRPRDLSLEIAPLDRELRVKPVDLAAAVKELVVPAPIAAWYSAR